MHNTRCTLDAVYSPQYFTQKCLSFSFVHRDYEFKTEDIAERADTSAGLRNKRK